MARSSPCRDRPRQSKRQRADPVGTAVLDVRDARDHAEETVEVETVSNPDRRSAVAERIESGRDPRGDVVAVLRKGISEAAASDVRDVVGDLGPEPPLVADSRLYQEAPAHLPFVLSKERQLGEAVGSGRVAVALSVCGRQ